MPAHRRPQIFLYDPDAVGVELNFPSGRGQVLSVAFTEIERVELFADGAPFGETGGPYERVIGVAMGEVDPRRPATAGIALIDKAPRNATRQGRVPPTSSSCGPRIRQGQRPHPLRGQQPRPQDAVRQHR
jgi:hypothetical protein